MQNLVNVRDFFDPAHDGDWTSAFQKAIAASVAGGNGGVFVPADKSPYTVGQPGQQMPSIDLRGQHNFTLIGEGCGSVIQMTGPGGGSWFMIHIGGHAENITVRDLILDGNRTGLAHPGKQTHLIKIGGSDHVSGGAAGVKVLNCMLTGSAGDGIAILPTDAPAGSGAEVSDVRIAFCSFTGNGRSGISTQRSSRLVQILHNHFEGNSDQDIDLEPTGNTPGSGPSGYLIFGNSIVHGNATVAVTLSGVSGTIPASGNTFACNQIRGGTLGLVNPRDTLITGNYIEAGLTSPGPVVRLTGRVEGGPLRGQPCPAPGRSPARPAPRIVRPDPRHHPGRRPRHQRRHRRVPLSRLRLRHRHGTDAGHQGNPGRRPARRAVPPH